MIFENTPKRLILFFFMFISFFENKGMEPASLKGSSLARTLCAMRLERENKFKELSIPFRHLCNKAIRAADLASRFYFEQNVNFKIPQAINLRFNHNFQFVSIYPDLSPFKDDETFNECMIKAISDHYNHIKLRHSSFCYPGHEGDPESDPDNQFVYYALMLGTSGALKSLKRQIKENQNFKRYAGTALLYYCTNCCHSYTEGECTDCECWSEWNKEAKFLLDAEVPLNESYSYYAGGSGSRIATTPLIVLANHLYLKRIEQLLQLGVRVNCPDESGKNALDAARNPSHTLCRKDQAMVIKNLELHALHEDRQSFFSLLPFALIREITTKGNPRVQLLQPYPLF